MNAGIAVPAHLYQKLSTKIQLKLCNNRGRKDFFSLFFEAREKQTLYSTESDYSN